jgi:hypothetical protein
LSPDDGGDGKKGKKKKKKKWTAQVRLSKKRDSIRLLLKLKYTMNLDAELTLKNII